MINGTSTTENLAQPTSETTGYAYNSSYNQSNYVGWTYSGTSQRTLSGTNSNAKTQLQTWYDSNLNDYDGKIAEGKYCNDREAGSGYTWAISPSSTFYYAAYKRLETNKKPTFSCSNAGDVYTLKVGLITADEVAFAGGVYGTSNDKYYLYNGQYYWTMSPYSWLGAHARVFAVRSNGYLNDWNVDGTYSLRPAINLRSDVTFSSGDGTISSPYVVS